MMNSTNLKIVADNKIAHVKTLFSPTGEVICIDADDIRADTVANADILLVRSVTKVDANLLANSSISFVGTATAGTDHLDTDWLQQQNINWASAPGCNASAVAEYVLSCIAYLIKHQDMTINRIGIIGVGHAGTLVHSYLTQLGFSVICNDPPKANLDPSFDSTPLSEFNNLDLISIHCSLTHTGQWPSLHLINQDFLQQQSKGTVLINTTRGEIINSQDLKQYGKHCLWCLDVWENEPNIDLDILKHCTIATPHIAGYSIDAKQTAANMLMAAMLNKPIDNKIKKLALTRNNWVETVLNHYNPAQDTKQLKTLQNFKSMRQQYLLRHEL